MSHVKSSLMSRVVLVIRERVLDTHLEEATTVPAVFQARMFMMENATTRKSYAGWLLFDWERLEWNPNKHEEILWLCLLLEHIAPADFKQVKQNELTCEVQILGRAREPFQVQSISYVHYEEGTK